MKYFSRSKKYKEAQKQLANKLAYLKNVASTKPTSSDFIVSILKITFDGPKQQLNE